jgi:F0F1-type ATP synthase assembly protein I
MAERKPDQKRGTVAFVFVIVLGLAIGIFIKRVQVGLIIGLVLGLLGSNFLRRK